MKARNYDLNSNTVHNNPVVSPFRYFFLLPLLLCAIALVTALVNFEFKESSFEEAEEEGEGIPTILRAMDAWSDMRTYPNKSLASLKLSAEFDKARTMADPRNAREESADASSWAALGPLNFAGRILSIGFHPSNPNVMWVGSASGGLYKTTTGGTGGPGGISWQFVPTGFPVLAISSIVVNPSNPDEIYIGTGEVYNPGATGGGATGAGHYRLFRGSYGIGILKTTDGGATWTKTLDFPQSSIKGVMDMLIHPSIPSTVFAATTDGIYRTTNSGASWQLIHSVPMAMDMVFKPGNPDVLYVGSGNFQTANNGIYKTTNANAVSPNFNKLTTGLPNPISGKIMLAMSAADPNKIYASVGNNPETAHTQGLYVSTNEGANWAVSGTNMLGSQGWYGHDIAASPTNANLILWAELDTYRSTDGGASKTKTGSWNMWDINNTTIGDITEGQSNTTGYVHADVHRIEASPHDVTGNTFFLCTDGGLFRTTNGGSGFNTLNGGLNTAQIYQNIAIHPSNPNYMLLGLQDNEASVYEGNQGHRRIGNLGDGFHSTMNSTGTTQIVESYYFNRRRSTNSGTSFSGGSGAVAEVACFNVPMVWSKAAGSQYVFAGTAHFKRSANSGSTWTDLNGGSPIAGANNPCIAMVAPTNSIVFFSTAPASGIRSKLWKTTNATVANPSFTEITGTLPDRYYSDIDIDPSNTNRVFVTLSGFGSSHVYMSLNGGTSWTNIGVGLPDVPANTVFINPRNPQQIYVGNDLGLFYANNVPTTGTLGASHSLTWKSYNEGIDDAVMVSDIGITSSDMLRLATYGRGIWERVEAPYVTLPVKFKQFDVTVTGDGNLLKWVVSDQVNVARYEVEYSTDGINYKKIASVAATPQTGDIKYDYLHKIYNDVDGYYRIKSVDFDDSYSFSAVRIVKAQKKVTSMVAYPNPVTNGVMKLKIPAARSGMTTISVYAGDGKLVLEKRYNLQQGTNILTVDVSRLAAGYYRVVSIAEDKRWMTTVLKDK